jgi:hypothetical protein
VVVFNPFGTPIKTAYAPVANLERRVEMSVQALDQAERDLEKARRRASVDEDDDRKRERIAKLEREGTLTERKRLMTILFSPQAARNPKLTYKLAFKTDVTADDAIAILDATAREDAQINAKATAALIVLAGAKRRGEVPCDVTAGPKRLVKATAEQIIAAGKKARGEI